jgi:Protein of unknown function (DUF4238)
MEAEQPKIYHHHTPRQYLLAWADADERIAWLGYGKVSRSGLTVVGGENDFYRLKELTVPDVDCLKLFIDGLREHGRDGHKHFLQMYLLPTRLKALLEQRIAEQQQRVAERGASEDDIGDAAMAQARHLLAVAIANFNEDYHASIERRFWPFLELIKQRDFSFYEDSKRAIDFIHGLFVQYFRTKAVKERTLQKENVLFDDMERVWDVLSHIMAIEAGGSFFVDRRNFQIVVLDNDTEVPFITSDQPIINMQTDGKNFDVPEKMELYYPLSPTQAMLYLEKSTPTGKFNNQVSIDDAHRYNQMMLDHSSLRVFSNSEEYLTFLKECAGVKKQSH